MNKEASDSAFPPIDATDVDFAGQKVLDQIRAHCALEPDFPAKVNSALRAALGIVAADPFIAHLLFAPCELHRVLERQEAWRQIFADELRNLAKLEAPSPTSVPPFVEPFLVTTVGSQVLRSVQRGEVGRREELQRELVAFIFIYYYPNAAEAQSRCDGLLPKRPARRDAARVSRSRDR